MPRARRALPGLLLLAGSVLAAAGPLGLPGLAAAVGADCVAPSPWKLLQDDAGSGRDAGDGPEGAVTWPSDGWHGGAFGLPVYMGLEDDSDWYRTEVPGPGPRTVHADIVMSVNEVVPDDNFPVVYYLEVWRPGDEVPVQEMVSWLPGLQFEAEPGPYLLHVHWPPWLVWPLCAPGAAPGGLAALPEEARAYSLRWACEPACKPTG